MRLRHRDADYYEQAARRSSARYKDSILHVCELDLARLEDEACGSGTECIALELGACEKAIDASGLSKLSTKEARERFLRCIIPSKLGILTRDDALDENPVDVEEVFKLEPVELELVGGHEMVLMEGFWAEKEVPLEATTVAGSVMEALFPMKQELHAWNYPSLAGPADQKQRQAKRSILTLDVVEPLEFDILDQNDFWLWEEFVPGEIPLEVLSDETSAVEKLLGNLFFLREGTLALDYSTSKSEEEVTFLLEPAMVPDEDQSLCWSDDPNFLSGALCVQPVELDCFEKLSADNMYQQLVVMPELSPSCQLLKLLPVPAFRDEEQDLLGESLFVKIASTSRYSQGSATDFLYFDWHLSQGSNCNNQQCFVKLRELECAPEKLPVVDLHPAVNRVAKAPTQAPLETKLQAHLEFPSAKPVRRLDNVPEKESESVALKRPVQDAATIRLRTEVHGSRVSEVCAGDAESVPLKRPVQDTATIRPRADVRASRAPEVYAGGAESVPLKRPFQDVHLRTEVPEVCTGEADSVTLERPVQHVHPRTEVPKVYAGKAEPAVLQEKSTLPDAKQPKVTGQHEMHDGCNLVVVANISLLGKHGVTSRRKTYQAVLNTEKHGGQVVERELKLPVDLILTAARCLVLYSRDKLSLHVSDADVAACIEGIIDSDMKAMSFCFRHCILVFEGDQRFRCSVLENMDDFYAAAVGLNVQVQCFVSSSIEDTEAIILNCIKESQQLMSRVVLPRMAESETIAEAFLNQFPAVNPLTAHAILSSGMSLSTFITLTHSEQVLATKAFDVPDRSLVLFKAQCEYGQIHQEQLHSVAEWPYGRINASSTYTNDLCHPACLTNPEDQQAPAEAEVVPYFPSVAELNEEWHSTSSDRFERPRRLAPSYFAPSATPLEDKDDEYEDRWRSRGPGARSWDCIEAGDVSLSSSINNDKRIPSNRTTDFGYSTNRPSSVENALKNWLETRQQQQQKSKASSNSFSSAPSVANKRRRNSTGSNSNNQMPRTPSGPAKFLDVEEESRRRQPAKTKARQEDLLSLWENFRYRSSASEHPTSRGLKGGFKRPPPPPALHSSRSKRVTI